MDPPAYYGTVPETAEERREHRTAAAAQELQVLAVFQATNQPLAPHEVWERLNTMAPITSIRRAMTNLTKRGELQKTDSYTRGPDGRRVHLWRLPPTDQKFKQMGLWE